MGFFSVSIITCFYLQACLKLLSYVKEGAWLAPKKSGEENISTDGNIKKTNESVRMYLSFQGELPSFKCVLQKFENKVFCLMNYEWGWAKGAEGYQDVNYSLAGCSLVHSPTVWDAHKPELELCYDLYPSLCLTSSCTCVSCLTVNQYGWGHQSCGFGAVWSGFSSFFGAVSL